MFLHIVYFFTHSYVAFYCGQAFQFSHILRALDVVSVSDNLDSKLTLLDVTADSGVLCEVGLDTFVYCKYLIVAPFLRKSWF